MSALAIRSAAACRYDLVALGEVMLRLDPGEGRVRTARGFRVWEGGGEYNVARGLRRCFGLRTAIVTALADNDIGRLVEDLMLQGGVDTSLVRWVPYDGIGRAVRNGLNFTERGFGVRGALGVSDRGNTAASQLAPGADRLGPPVRRARRALAAHRRDLRRPVGDDPRSGRGGHRGRGTPRHCRLLRSQLSDRACGRGSAAVERAREVNRRLAKHVDVMIGNEEDFTACLGLEVAGVDANLSDLDTAPFRSMIDRASLEFPNFRVVATTLRAVRSATVNDWGAIAWSRDDGFVEATPRPRLEIMDRVGGGDSFASGLIFGLMERGDLRLAAELGAAHGALAMTTPGDTSTATLAEVEALAAGIAARVQR